MHFIINKQLYQNTLVLLFIFLTIFLIGLILYQLVTTLKQHYTRDKIITESFGIKSIKRGLKKGLKKATSGISKAAEEAAKRVAEESRRVADETRKAAEEARRVAEEAAQAIQIQNAIKELNRSINRTSGIFETIGSGISEIKGLGSSYAKNITSYYKDNDI